MKRAGVGGFDKMKGLLFLWDGGNINICTAQRWQNLVVLRAAAGSSSGDFTKGGSQICSRSRNSPRAEPSHFKKKKKR